MASTSQLSNYQAGELERMLKEEPEKFSDEQRAEANRLLEAHAAQMTVLPGEEGAASQEQVNRRVRQDFVQNLDDAAKNALALPRGMARMPIAASNAVFNAGLEIINLSNAALSGFVGEDSPARKQLQVARNQMLAAKRATIAEQEAAFFDAYGASDTTTQKVLDSVGNLLGEIAPYAAAPAQFGSFLKTVMWNGALGSFAAASVTAEEAESLREQVKDMTYGGLVSAFVSGALNTPQGFARYGAQKVSRQLETEQAKKILQLEKNIQEVTGQPNFKFSLGQITQNPFVVGLEIGSARAIQREMQIKRIQILRDSLKMRAQSMRAAGKDPIEIVADLQETAENIIGPMRRTANKNFELGMDNVLATWGDDAIVDGSHYLDELQAAMDDLGNPLKGGHPNKVPAFMKLQERILQRYLTPYRTVKREIKLPDGSKSTVWDVVDQREFDTKVLSELSTAPHPKTNKILRFTNGNDAADWVRINNPVYGGLNSKQTRELLTSFRQVIGGEVPIWDNAFGGSQQALGRRLQSAFLTELEQGAKNPEAIGAIQSLRKVYQTDQAMMDGVRRSMLTDMLANPGQDAADDLLARMVNRKESEMVKFRRLLESNDPVLLDELRAETLDRVVRQSKMGFGRDSLGEVSFEDLGRSLIGKEGDPGSIAKGLWDEADRIHLARTGRALNVLQETHLNLFPEASASIIADTGINVVSQSKEFVTRYLLRLTTTGAGMSKALNDPAARDMFIKLANSKVGTPAYQYAAVGLAMLVAKYEADDIKAAAEAKRQQERDTDMRLAP